MFEQFKQKFIDACKWTWIELQRMWFVIIVSLLLIAPNDNRYIVAFALGIVTLTSIVIHLTRKTIWDYLNLKIVYDKALESSIGAAIVWAAIIWLTGITIQSVLVFLKP